MHIKISILALLGFLLTMGNAHGQEFVTAPYLQSPTTTSMWIAWETAGNGDSRVEWGPTDVLGETAVGHSHGGPGDHRHHEVRVTGLSPATRYYYRVHTGGLQSATYYFTTPPSIDSEAPTRFVAMSDMQRDGGNPDKYRQIVEEGVIPVVTAEHGDDLSTALSMALIPGDLVHNGNVYAEWADTFFAPGAALMAHVPFYPVLGNHENNTDYYFDYFHLPENGSPGFEEHWWYIDHSNVRVIGLDSNGGYRIPLQLEWLEGVLADACAADHIDFVFAQLHHPYHSELWPAGNTNYTGDVMGILENFSSDCGKPSLHFFGHTHGYSRGQSRDHSHTMVNVATAGGNVDYWDEYVQIDYPEYMVSQDEYGFVMVEVEAGDSPRFVLRRISQGNVINPRDNEERDRMEIRLNNLPPAAPVSVGPLAENVSADCLTVAVTPFDDVDGDDHQATQWQLGTQCDFLEPVADIWHQAQNWYRNEDRRAGLSLIAQEFKDLQSGTEYCWRARFRDSGMVWSEWSEPQVFLTGDGGAITLPLLNPGGEEGTDSWTVERGVFESVEEGECESVEPFSGERFFVVGGVCESTDLAIVSQRIDISPHLEAITAEGLFLRFGGHLRNWDGRDEPSLWARFIGADDAVLSETDPVGSNAAEWTRVVDTAAIPEGAMAVELVLRGQRLAGEDNDSYFDDLFVALSDGEEACAPPPESPDSGVSDMGINDMSVLDDMGTAQDLGGPEDMNHAGDSQPMADDSGSDGGASDDATTMADAMAPASSDAPAAGCDGCSVQGGPEGILWVMGLLLIGALRRRA